jgi:DNA polymerase I-like protein with 3'-5' exonuclease and polymerase domains
MTFSPSYGLIGSTEEFEQLCAKLVADGKPFGFDIETSYDGEPREHAQLHPEENFVAGLSFTNDLTWARYAALRHDFGTNLDNKRAAIAFWPVAQTGLGIPHNAKFERRCLARWFMEHLSEHPLFGAAVRKALGYFPVLSDTMLESYVEARHRFHGLKEITLLTFGHKMRELFDLFPQRLTKKGEPRKLTQKEQACIRFSELDQNDPKVIAYACEDSLWALANYCKRYPVVRDNFIYKLEMAILPIACKMEDNGIQYDWNFMREGALRARAFQEKLAQVINAELTRLVRQKLGPEHPEISINLASPAQVSDVLYGKLGLVTRRKSQKTGKPSTDEVALTGLAKSYPVVRRMLIWKALNKLAGTYLEVYEERFSYAPDGRAHPSWLQHGVPAGRFAAASPPVQQSPKHYHYVLTVEELRAAGFDTLVEMVFDFNFRDAIVAPQGYYLIGFDYKNQELRVLAGEAQEPALLEAFSRGEDVHRLTAGLMLGKPITEVTADERQDFGKVMNFALSYQMGVKGLADRLGISQDEAQALFDHYFAIYTRVKGWMDQTVASSKALGYVTTRFGRIVRIFEYESADRYIYSQGERLAGNAPIQGAGTGDYTKIAMVRAEAALEQAGLGNDQAQLVMNMHDALYWYVRNDVAPADFIRIMEPAVVFPVEGWPPIEVEWCAGRRWGSMRELEVLEDGSVRVHADEKAAPVESARAPEAGGLQHGAGDGLPAEPSPAGGSADGAPATAPCATSVDGPGLSGTGRGVIDAGNVAEPSRTVIVTLDRMPEAMAWESFSALLRRELSPGPNEVLIRTPEGELLLPGQYRISPAWQPDISVLLGGATVTYAPDSVDTAALAAGLSL